MGGRSVSLIVHRPLTRRSWDADDVDIYPRLFLVQGIEWSDVKGGMVNLQYSSDQAMC